MTRLEAANKALILLGVATISSLNQDIQAARVMNELFPSVERAVLLEYPWPFSQLATALNPIPNALPPLGWRYAFNYPTEAIALHKVYARDLDKVNYVVQRDIIYTNESGVYAEYTVVTDFEQWPGLVAEAFTARLASDASSALVGSKQAASVLLQKYGILLSMARSNALNEENVPHRRAARYLDVRR